MAHILTLDEVRRLAELAKLELTDEQASRYQKELSDILEYIAVLDEVSTDGLGPTTQVTGLKNIMRRDIASDQAAKANDLLNLAPQSQDRYIKVKRMI